MSTLRVGIDIGGVISRYPYELRAFISALVNGGADVFIVTDMNNRDALATCRDNGITKLIPDGNVISCDWSHDGDLCKTKAIESLELDMMFDDRPDYVASGNFIGFVLSPRPNKPYYHNSWVNNSTAAVCVPPEEYEDFKKWRKSKH